MHSGKLVSNKKRLEHETPTRMFNGIQISNLEALIKVSSLWVKALGYYTESIIRGCPQNALQIRLVIFPSTNGTRIDFNYHLILISLSCQKVLCTHETKGCRLELIYATFKGYRFVCEISTSLVVTGRLPQRLNQMTGSASMPIGLAKTDEKETQNLSGCIL